MQILISLFFSYSCFCFCFLTEFYIQKALIEGFFPNLVLPFLHSFYPKILASMFERTVIKSFYIVSATYCRQILCRFFLNKLSIKNKFILHFLWISSFKLVPWILNAWKLQNFHAFSAHSPVPTIFFRTLTYKLHML